jgi:hypothetical protein
MAAPVSAEELRRRTAALKRLRDLLQDQRNRFQDYLEALERQKSAIEQGSAEEISAWVELEERLVAGILAIQRVINPLEAVAGTPGAVFDEALEGLKRQASARSARNRELLARRMSALKGEIAALRAANPYRGSRSIYADAGGGSGAASRIDIRG